jgi:hypothetical protein
MRPVDSKVLTPRERPRGGEKGDVDSKRMTPRKREDVDESKSEGSAAAPDEATVWRTRKRRARAIA